MKKTLLLSFVAIGILISGCSNKQDLEKKQLETFLSIKNNENNVEKVISLSKLNFIDGCGETKVIITNSSPKIVDLTLTHINGIEGKKTNIKQKNTGHELDVKICTKDDKFYSLNSKLSVFSPNINSLYSKDSLDNLIYEVDTKIEKNKTIKILQEQLEISIYEE